MLHIPNPDGTYDDYCQECAPVGRELDFAKAEDRKRAEEMIEKAKHEGNPMAPLIEQDYRDRVEQLRQQGLLEE